MYQARVRHLLSPISVETSSDFDEAMWELFSAIGRFWKLTDDPGAYKLRLHSFMRNRIDFNPLYRDFYIVAKRVVESLVSKHGSAKGYEILFTQKSGLWGAPPETEIEFVQQYVVNELIGLRLALGGFKDFGAVNYCGYFGGPNIEGEPPPYRTGCGA